MRLLPIHPFNLAVTVEPFVPRSLRQTAVGRFVHGAELLHRTNETDAPDPRYWTAYDHFMLEREARARRRACAYRLIARARDALRRGLRAVRSAAARRAG